MQAYDTRNAQSMNAARYVADNHRDKMRGSFYNSWIPHWMWIMDLFLFIIVCVGVGIARDSNGFKPWEMVVYRVHDTRIIKAAINDYAAMENWSPGMSDYQILNVAQDFVRDVGVELDPDFDFSQTSPHFWTSSALLSPFVKCVTNGSKVIVRDVLKAPFSEGDDKKFKKQAWGCLRAYHTPSHISKVTTINVLLCLLIWCVHALVARSFANLSMTDKIHEVPPPTPTPSDVVLTRLVLTRPSRTARRRYLATKVICVKQSRTHPKYPHLQTCSKLVQLCPDCPLTVLFAWLFTGPREAINSMTSTVMSLSSTITSGVSFLLALAVLGWTMFENVDADGDFAAANIILLFVVFLGIVYSGIVVFRNRNPRPWSDVTGLTAEDFNAAWTIVAFMKPHVVAPVYTCIVLAMSGVTELFSLTIATVLSFTLAFISASLSYSNLYATHRDRSDAYNISLAERQLSYEQATQEQQMNMRMQKARRPMNVVVTSLVILCILCFSSWPRRTDVGILWGMEFTIFFLLIGLGSMVLPDVIFHRRFNQAMVMREQSEIVFRTLIVLMVLSFVF